MDNKELNLQIIINQYRNKGPAMRGYKVLHKLIKNNLNNNLETLLRDHTIEPIEQEFEVQERDNIDFLIDFYSILEIGIIAGYLPNKIPSKLEHEIIFILGNRYVNRYFSKYYPLYLPQLLLDQLWNNEIKYYLDDTYLHSSSILFEKFLVLNQSVKSDSDIDQFLWFLDDGFTGGSSIRDLWGVLLDRNIIKYKLSRDNSHPLNSALLGFIKYVQFLSDYADLLRQTGDINLLQSAFWHHQSYWFDHMKDKLGDIIKVAIKNIRTSMNATVEFDLINDKQSFINDPDDYSKWQDNANQLGGTEEDISYLLNPKLGYAIKELF